jgi:hypothetical protein
LSCTRGSRERTAEVDDLAPRSAGVVIGDLAKVSGQYWFHRQPQSPAAAASDPSFQDQLVAKLSELAGVSLF